MVVLAIDEAAEVENHALGVVSLAGESGVGVLESGDLLLVALSLTLQFFSNLLLQDKGFESIIALLLCARKTEGETSSIVLLLINEATKSAVFTLVVLNFDFELRGFLRELLSKRLEFEELLKMSEKFLDARYKREKTNLLLPGLQLLDQKVVPLGNLGELGVHSPLEVDEILPCLESIPGVLVTFADNLIEMSHRNLGHQWLLD